MSDEAIIEIREEGEKLLNSLNLEIYRNLSGLKKDSALGSIYRSHPSLNDPDLFLTLKDTSSSTDEEEKGLRLLKSFLSRTVLESQTAHIKDQIIGIETGEKIQTEHITFPFRSYSAALRVEPARKIRVEIDEQKNDIVKRINPHLVKMLDLVQNASEDLGFSTYRDLIDNLEHINIRELVEKAKILLTDTEYIYRDLLKWFLLRRMEIRIEDAKIHDLYYLFNSFELKSSFPETDLRSLAKKFLYEMNLKIGENIKVDSEKRISKVMKPFCTPIEVPNNVVFSFYPIGGVHDYESFMYGLGNSFCFGFSKRDDDFEFRRLRELSVLETFGHLFRNLILQPKWLKKYLRLDTGRDFNEFLYLRHLMILRCYCGKLIYENSFHVIEDHQDNSESFKQSLKEATLAEFSEADYLIEIEPFLYSAIYLKATFIESGLGSYLTENFDEEWWRSAQTGIFLRNLWTDGGRITSRDLAKIAGFDELDLTSLYESLNEHLG